VTSYVECSWRSLFGANNQQLAMELNSHLRSQMFVATWMPHEPPLAPAFRRCTGTVESVGLDYLAVDDEMGLATYLVIASQTVTFRVFADDGDYYSDRAGVWFRNIGMAPDPDTDVSMGDLALTFIYH